jgi:two-component system LytT family response regulator
MRGLKLGLQRLRSQPDTWQESADGSASEAMVFRESWLERLVIRTRGRVWFVQVADIEWVEAAGYNIRIHTAEQTYTTRLSLTALVNRLDPRRFVRVHRSAIVNLDRVSQIEPYINGAYTIVLKDGAQIRLSRSMRPALEEALQDQML